MRHLIRQEDASVTPVPVPPLKKSRWNKWHVVSIVLVIVVLSQSVIYVNLSLKSNSLVSDYERLKDQYDDLESEYGFMESEHSILETQRDSLQTQYSALQIQYSDLQGDYSALQLDYDSLRHSFDVEKCLRIGNSLESYYDLLRQELGSTGADWWWTFSESYWQAAADFAANLALHDLRRIYWPSIESEYYGDVGEYSYDTAYRKINEVVGLIGTTSYHSSTDKIRMILDFVDEQIHYESEVNDIFLAPVETLGFKSGDCDDFSILTAALFEAVGIDTAVGLFRNDEDEYHAMVLVHLDDLGSYRYWYYSDLTGRGLDAGRWIEIEPQLPIENQGGDWLRQWNIMVAAPLDT
jgi:cell division protein FtsL